MMPKRKVVVFDLDDTLYKEIDYLQSAYHHIAFLVSNVNTPEAEVYQLMTDTYRQGKKPFEAAIEKFHFQLYDVQWMLAVYRNHKPHISLDKIVEESLAWLKAHDAILGLVTDGRVTQQMNKIDALGLKKFVNEDDIIINEAEEFRKPDQRSFQYFMDKYGKDADYWYVGDNPDKDFKGPNRLGWHTVCLRDDGRNIHQQRFDGEKSSLPTTMIDHIDEILQVIP